ncbi:YacC family pilotin-like protein [Photorhabdus asymbiotica]|uniref:YacC family pilotin-like protein n=1 Tax=Photorhabdus asymbiotica TaxID=291112 RepID=UPI003DA7784C
MRKLPLLIYILVLFGFSHPVKALTEDEAEDLADLTAVFIYLKYDCGYSQIPDREIKRAIIYFAQRNKWDLNNYNSQLMNTLNEESYQDLKGIYLSNAIKCHALARDSLSLFAYVK